MAKIRNKYGQGMLPSSVGGTLDKAGIENAGYVDKKGTPSGIEAGFNALPPGQNIEDQTLADIRDIPMKDPMATGYSDDGWPSVGGQKRKEVTKGHESNVDLPLAGTDSDKE